MPDLEQPKAQLGRYFMLAECDIYFHVSRLLLCIIGCVVINVEQLAIVLGTQQVRWIKLTSS